MPLGTVAHGQHVVGEPGALAPGGRHADVCADHLLVGEHLQPGHAVRIGPDRVVDAGEVGVYPAAPLFEQVRHQEAHLVEAQWVLLRPEQLAPVIVGRRDLVRFGHELVPGTGRGATLDADGAGEHVEEPEGAGYLPAA